MITFYCSNCGTKISAEPEYARASANCPTCAHDLVVPSALGDATVESQDPAVGISGQSPDVYTSGETRGENEMSRENAEHSLGDRLKTGAKDGWSSIKSQSKQAALRTQIEKLKNVELRMAHHSLGKKCFESGIFDLQFSEQFQAIRNLDATIAEKRSDEEVEDDETKVAALKRMGIHAVKESQAQALLLKRRVLLAELGKSAFLIGGSADLSGIGPERAVIEAIETRIRCKEAETLEIQKAGEGKSRIPMITIVALLIIVVSAGAIMGLKSLAGGGDSLRSGKYDAEAASTINLEQEKIEIERDFRRLFPDANYSDLDKEYSDGGMVGFVREMISVGSAMASIYPEHRSEVRQWENLKARMDTYKQLKSKIQH